MRATAASMPIVSTVLMPLMDSVSRTWRPSYATRKNRRNDPDRLTLRKYAPVVGRHVDFREERGEP